MARDDCRDRRTGPFGRVLFVVSKAGDSGGQRRSGCGFFYSVSLISLDETRDAVLKSSFSCSVRAVCVPRVTDRESVISQRMGPSVNGQYQRVKIS